MTEKQKRLERRTKRDEVLKKEEKWEREKYGKEEEVEKGKLKRRGGRIRGRKFRRERDEISPQYFSFFHSWGYLSLQSPPKRKLYLFHFRV